MSEELFILGCLLFLAVGLAAGHNLGRISERQRIMDILSQENKKAIQEIQAMADKVKP